MTDPTKNPNRLTSFVILSNGMPIDNAFQVNSIKVEKAVNTISSCEIVLRDGDPASRNWMASDSKTFVPGAKIEVKAGYSQKDETIFKGIVMSQNIRVDEAQDPVLIVNCFDEGIKLTVGRKNESYQNKTDSDIWKSIIATYNSLSANITATKTKLAQIVQYYSTDWDFLVSRAEFNGMVTMAMDNTLTITDPNQEKGPVLTVTYGDNMLSFNADMSALHQYQDVESISWDDRTQKTIQAKINVSGAGQGNLSTSKLSEVIGLKDYLQQTNASLDAGSLKTWSGAQATKSKFAKIRGEVSFQGSALAEPGKLIQLTGLSDRFNGNAYMSGVTHSISGGNWVTEVKMGLSAEWYASKVAMQAPLAAGVLPGIQGLQNGVVKRIDQDPANEYRVLVNVPLVEKSGEGIWARLSTLYANDSTGAMFYPEIGDEVVLGFLNDDPRYPVILGSVYSQKNNPPYTPDEKNSTKAIVTKRGQKLIFDDENREITAITENRNQIVLSDRDNRITIKDQNENSIVMSDSGITIKSSRNLSLEAGQEVWIKANSGINLNSEGSVQIDGLEVKVTGETSLDLSGGAQASLKGGGETVIQGGLVMIN